jgi:hypothetical protein
MMQVRMSGARVTVALATLLTIFLMVIFAAAAPGVLLGLRAQRTEPLEHALVGASFLSLVACPLFLMTVALMCGASWRVGRRVWGRALFVFPAAALAGYTFVTLLLLNYTPMILFALGGATICAALFAWGNLTIIHDTLTPVLMPDLTPSTAPLPPHEA